MKLAANAITIRRANERGHTSLGWLDSHHSFSFSDYYDPAHMGFRSLRVINDDHVAPGGGFPSHPHRDMEIFSYALEGSLQHRDSLGNGRTLEPGQIQLMSAGTGVIHSEYNPSTVKPAHFLQIWIEPRQRRLSPRYTEWRPDATRQDEAKVLVISPDGREGSAVIQQDTNIYRIRLKPGQTATHLLKAGHGAWLQVARGELIFNEIPLSSGDGAAIESAGTVQMAATTDAEALLFDLK